jgi:glycine/D-amino acid oxidase-like deaminating enzyme
MKNSVNADVVVVGGGINGLATALHLSELGVRRIIVLERDYVGAGQSGRAAGIVRALVAHRQVSKWQLESQRSLLNFTERFGVPIEVHQPGYLLVGHRADEAFVRRSVDTAVQAGAEARLIDVAEALELQPGLRQGEDVLYAYETGAVHVDPMPVTYALATAARRAGVEICEGCSVEELLVDSDRIIGVRAAGKKYHAAAVMIATAAWGRSQLKQLDLDVPVYPHRAEMAFFQVPLDSTHRLLRILSDSRAGLYLRPEGACQMFVGRREGDLVSSPEDFIAEDPDNYRQTAYPGGVQDMHAQLASALAFMKQGFVHRTYACVYDYTPDGMPMLDAAGPAGLYYALGFSGGGFSTALCVGRAMAQFITTAVKPPEIEWLRHGRFAEGDLVDWSNAGKNS